MPFFKSTPAPPPAPVWQVGPAIGGAFACDAAAAGSGTLVLDKLASGYVTLGPTASKFSRLPNEAGQAVSRDDIYRLIFEAEAKGKVAQSLMVLEYDDARQRIGTRRYRGTGTWRYTPGHKVAFVLVALRLGGTGSLEIAQIGWEEETAIRDRGLSHIRHESDPRSLAPSGKRLVIDRKSSDPFTLAPTGSAQFCAFDLPRGRYEIELRHRDPVLAKHSRDLIAYLETDHEIALDRSLPMFGMERRPDGAITAKVSGQARGDGSYRTAIEFTLLDDQPWVVVELGSSLDRFVNVDKARIGPFVPADPKPVEGTLFAPEVGRFVNGLDEAEDIQTLVYADISLNVVDGSSVWLSSLLSMLTAQGRCLFVSKYNVESEVVLANVTDRENLVPVQPSDLSLRRPLQIEDAIEVVQRLDERLANLRNVIVRGTAVVEALFETRRFAGRGFAYLTDFYRYGDAGIEFPEEKQAVVRVAATQAGALLMQNRQVELALEKIAGRPFGSCLLPPAIPHSDPSETLQAIPAPGKVRIGYAGKINPRWGIAELLDWTERLQADGIDVELTIVSNKISDNSGDYIVEGFRHEVVCRIEALGGTLYRDFHREQAMAMMNAMDFVWCWRPADLEDHTLEISTKLIEMVALDARCICYPNAINRELLGDDYPFFATDFEGVAALISADATFPDGLATQVEEQFSLSKTGERLLTQCLHDDARKETRLLVAGNGLKFIEPYVSRLKASGHPVKIDPWEWGRAINEAELQSMADWADVVLCEWGLANAAWYSNNLPAGKRLVVRVHAQEVREKAQRFGHAIDADRVDLFVFVSERIRRTAIDLFGWPEDKTVVIPNFLLDREYRLRPREDDGVVQLGLVGMIPSSKRLDRALDLLAALSRRGIEARLHVKGHRPEELDYMFSPGRIGEMSYYADQYERIASDPLLRGKVLFDGWGNDVAHWYEGIDVILSPSDHESFHYALADGVLSGCLPLVWPWEEAGRTYDEQWVVEDAETGADRVQRFAALDPEKRADLLEANRAMLVDRYGQDAIYPRLDEALGLV